MNTTIGIEYLKKKIKKPIYKNKRFILLCCFVLISLISLLSRMTYLQVINKNKLIHTSNLRSLRIQSIPKLRGIITDRNGKLLAISMPVHAVFSDPKYFFYQKNDLIQKKKWKILANILSIPLNKILHRINSYSKSRFVYLARQIHPEMATYIKKLNLPGIYLLEESRRYYPTGKIMSHLIGFTNIDSQGIEGIEKSFDQLLSGKSRKRIVRIDRYGHIIEHLSFINKSKPNNLCLSIDQKLQEIVFYALNKAVKKNNALSGTAVLIDIKTSEVLAMVNSPGYDPNKIKNNTNIALIRNRAITDLFEPGSTIKPIIIMAALQEGIVKKNTILKTSPYTIKNYTIKDVSFHKFLNLTQILKKSSNVGVSKLSLQLPVSILKNIYSKFGINTSTRLGLIGEKKGFYSKKKYWSKIEKATFSFGYGFMITPLQLARLYTIIGNYGVYKPLSIIKIHSPTQGKRIFPKSIVTTVIKMLENVAMPGGSGVKAAVKNFHIAVKTGTTKKVGKNKKYINQYVAYTAGIAPAKNPKLALMVMIDTPKSWSYYGGTISAPVFSTIMESVLRHMNIKPDALIR